MIRFIVTKATILCAIAFLTLGCLGETTPPDMPKLQPTTITIVQEGAPCPDANVQLLKKDDLTYKWFAGGVTDSTGKCVIRTLGKYVGAPEGDFTVVVYKTVRNESETRKNTPEPTDPAEAQQWIKKVAEEEKEFDMIDVKYKKIDTSDLTISIVSGKNEQTFDVGPAVQIENKPTLQKL